MPFYLLAATLCDPRGRCNRKGLLIAAGVMLAAEVALALGLWLTRGSLDSPLVVPFKLAMIYLAVTVAVQRLHDLGMSAWRILWATLALLVWSLMQTIAIMLLLSPEQMAPGQFGFMLVFVGIALPMLAMLSWLHFAPGDASANRYGQVPSGLGFSSPAGRGHHSEIAFQA